MRKLKTQKGITLVALVITIIVLIILAMVAIRGVQNDGIINYAKNATGAYEESKTTESSLLQGYANKIQQTLTKQPNTWKDNGNGTFTSTSGITVKIGDYVDYDEGTGYTHTPVVAKGAGTGTTSENPNTINKVRKVLTTSTVSTQDLKWRVLGVNANNQLELISADPTQQEIYLANDEGYFYSEENLNGFCNDLYGKGKNAVSARSLNAEDINKLTHFDKSSFKDILQAWNNGVKVIYRYPTQAEMNKFTGTSNSTRYMQYSIDEGVTWNNATDSTDMTFRLPGDTIAIGKNNPGTKELVNDFYGYSIKDELTIADGYTSEEVTEIVKMITQGSSDKVIGQWLDSKRELCFKGNAWMAIQNIYTTGKLNNGVLFDTSEGFCCLAYKVRPVVTLSEDVEVKMNSLPNSVSNMWTLR